MVSVGNFPFKILQGETGGACSVKEIGLSKMAVAAENIDTRADVSAC